MKFWQHNLYKNHLYKRVGCALPWIHYWYQGSNLFDKLPWLVWFCPWFTGKIVTNSLDSPVVLAFSPAVRTVYVHCFTSVTNRQNCQNDEFFSVVYHFWYVNSIWRLWQVFDYASILFWKSCPNSSSCSRIFSKQGTSGNFISIMELVIFYY